MRRTRTSAVVKEFLTTLRAVEETLKQHVEQLRRRGVTWTQIGEALSVSRQAARERFSGEE
jgi:hypothetical protein